MLKVDLYTWSWNDAHMLGFLFRHYDDLVQRYVVHDDGSTDDTLDILRANPKVEIRPVSFTGNPSSLVQSFLPFFEQCWKESRDTADWVIVTEIDEHLYHPDLPAYLNACKAAGVTIIPALGYQMLSDTFPSPDLRLCEHLTMGAPWVQMNKLNIFSPKDIDRVNYSLGRHAARPTGYVVLPECDELLLLHYKYLGFENTFRRHQQCAARLREKDIAKGWAHKWRWTREQLREDWEQFERRLMDVSRLHPDPSGSHSAPRWWRASPTDC